MKKLFLFLSVLLCSCMVSYAQEDNFLIEDSLTEEEKTVTEKDLDDAYIVPNSKFVGKKWYLRSNRYYIFNANGTFKWVEVETDTDYGDPIHIHYVDQGTWKRNKQYLNITKFNNQYTATPDASELKNFSLRKQDQIKRDYANVQKNHRNEYEAIQHDKYELQKVTNDILVIYVTYLNTDHDPETYYFVSPKKRDEIVNWKAGKSAKKREAEGAAEGNQTGGKIYDLVEQMPSFKGNISQWLSSNLTYPEAAAANGIQGRVIVQFVVEKDGSIGNVQVVSSVSPALDHEAVDVVKRMPLWNPGMQDGSPVRVKFTLPITFKL